MSLLWYPLAAMIGGVVGAFAHESIHAGLAVVVGELEGVGWQDGLSGGPYVDFRADSRLASELVRKAPLVVGVVWAAIVVAAFDGVSTAWMFTAGSAAGLLWTSPEDLYLKRAEQSQSETA